MHIWIVTWVLITIVPPGQWQAHEPDDYGVGGYQTSTSGAHGTDHERALIEDFEKVFLTEEAARAFIKGGETREDGYAKKYKPRYRLFDFKLKEKYAELPHKWDETGKWLGDKYYLRLEDSQVIKISALRYKHSFGMFVLGAVVGGILFHVLMK